MTVLWDVVVYNPVGLIVLMTVVVSTYLSPSVV